MQGLRIAFELCAMQFVKHLDLVRHLDGQPLQILARDDDSGTYLWNLEIWHERLAAMARTRAAGLLQPEEES
jgi:hypothetical protein